MLMRHRKCYYWLVLCILWSIRVAITKMLPPFVHIIKIFDVCGTIHRSAMYGILESVLGCKRGLTSVNPYLTSLWIRSTSQFCPPSPSVRLGKLLRIRFWHHGLKRHGPTSKPRTDWHGVQKVHGFWTIGAKSSHYKQQVQFLLIPFVLLSPLCSPPAAYKHKHAKATKS